MRIAKRIDMNPLNNNGKSSYSAILIVDLEYNKSSWILNIKKNGKTIEVPVSSGTILSLLMAERNFQSSITDFYEVE